MAKAIRYLDAYHANDHTRKVQSDIRGLAGAPPAVAASTDNREFVAAALFEKFPRKDVETRS
jgi:hypothetical protein